MAYTADEAFSLLRAAHARDRLAHAYLITGPIGCGKRQLAGRLASLLLGEAGEPWENPDVHAIEPESKSRRILTEQIRQLESALQLRSFFGKPKIGIIFDAERLQPNAANAFLKTLEEPPGRTQLLLISAQPDQLLETIISRCHEVPLRPTALRPPSELQARLIEVLRRYSAQSGAEIVGAFALAREFQQCLTAARAIVQDQADADLKREEQHYKQTSDARAWLDDREEYYKALVEARYQAERAALVETLEQWWADILRLQLGASGLDFPQHRSDTAALASQLTTPQLLRKSAALERLRENLSRTGVQEQLAIECAFLQAFAA